MGIPSHLFEALAPEDELLVPRSREHRQALERINNGTFGLCIECERPIEPERLESTPLTQECRQCARSEAQGRA